MLYSTDLKSQAWLGLKDLLQRKKIQKNELTPEAVRLDELFADLMRKLTIKNDMRTFMFTLLKWLLWHIC